VGEYGVRIKTNFKKLKFVREQFMDNKMVFDLIYQDFRNLLNSPIKNESEFIESRNKFFNCLSNSVKKIKSIPIEKEFNWLFHRDSTFLNENKLNQFKKMYIDMQEELDLIERNNRFVNKLIQEGNNIREINHLKNNKEKQIYKIQISIRNIKHEIGFNNNSDEKLEHLKKLKICENLRKKLKKDEEDYVFKREEFENFKKQIKENSFLKYFPEYKQEDKINGNSYFQKSILYLNREFNENSKHFSDYKVLKHLEGGKDESFIYLVKLNNDFVEKKLNNDFDNKIIVLKRIIELKKNFNQVLLLDKLNHPCIIKINGFSFPILLISS
jgi:hypothetical protein